MAETEQERFSFGENWLDFLRILSDEHIVEAEKALHAVWDRQTDLPESN